MHVANFRENPLAPPSGGELSWALDAAIIIGAAAAIFVTVIPAGLWVHRGQRTVAPVVFTASGNPDAAEAVAGPTGAPLMWRVSQGQATLYLFASVSSHHRDLGWMDSRLFQAFDGANAVWLDSVPAAPRDGDLNAERGPLLMLAQRAQRLGKPVSDLGQPAPASDVVMAGLWRSGDERGLLVRATRTGALDPVADTSRFEDALASGKTVFAAVDVTRLIGPGGLVAQLRRAGHKVERLDP